MKKWMVLLLMPVFLLGCSREEALETVNDTAVQPVAAALYQPAVQLPEGAAVSVMQSEENGSIYFCDGYTVTLQSLTGGDLDSTLKAATGLTAEQLHPLQTDTGNATRYDFAWTCAGEGEDQVCRGAVLDDGSSHHILTCMTGQSDAFGLQETWNGLFRSFCLTAPGEDLYTGS